MDLIDGLMTEAKEFAQAREENRVEEREQYGYGPNDFREYVYDCDEEGFVKEEAIDILSRTIFCMRNHSTLLDRFEGLDKKGRSQLQTLIERQEANFATDIIRMCQAANRDKDDMFSIQDGFIEQLHKQGKTTEKK